MLIGESLAFVRFMWDEVKGSDTGIIEVNAVKTTAVDNTKTAFGFTVYTYGYLSLLPK